MKEDREARAEARAERRFRELLESAPDAIIEVDGEGRIVLLNVVTEEMFGYSREELLGQSVEALVPENLREIHAGHHEHYWVIRSHVRWGVVWHCMGAARMDRAFRSRSA